MSEPVKPIVSHWRSRLRRLLFSLAALATLIALFYAEEDWRGKHAWKSYVEESRAKGIELDWHAYVPPPVPDDQNFAMSPLFEGLFDYQYTASNTLWRNTNIWARMERVALTSPSSSPKWGDWTHGRSLNLETWQNWFRTSKYPQANYWPKSPKAQEPARDVLLALSKLNPEMAALREASIRPQSRFPVHYGELPNAYLVHLSFLVNLARTFQLRAIAELETGDTPSALADIKVALRCAEAIKSEPFFISLLVRCRILRESIQPLWEGLRLHRWTEAEVIQLQRCFSNMDLLASYDEAFNAENAFVCGWIDALPKDPSSLSFSDIPILTVSQARNVLEIIPCGWFEQNELSEARFSYQTALPDMNLSLGRAYPSVSRTNLALFDKIALSPYTIAFKALCSVPSPQKIVQVQTDLNLAVVACALERFRAAHGHFPQALVELAPEFLKTLPHDIINGEPLKYGLTADGGFILYSVGWNETDDGGAFPGEERRTSGGIRAQFKYEPEAGDWVWKYPAAN